MKTFCKNPSFDTRHFNFFDEFVFNFNRKFPIENATHSNAFLLWLEVMNLGLVQTACKYISMVLKMRQREVATQF